MHGRPRKAAKPEDEAASLAKAQKLRSLQSQFLSNHHSRSYTKEARDLSARLLEANPESYTAWNYRKLAVQHRIAESGSDPDSLTSILDEELRVVENALRQNFKSYGAWHHRKWVLSKGHSSIDHELHLLGRLQKADSRNFHAWNYRRFVSEKMNRSEEDELSYTTDMINASFSNYSAWHNRSILLSSLLERKVVGLYSKQKTLNDEFELVHQAIFTDPDDQSGWFYYHWLLDQTVKSDAPRLVSCLPANGSDFTVSRDHSGDEIASSTFPGFHSNSGTFPLVLYFSQAVQGVSSATITVDSSICSNSDLIWEPLSTNKSSVARVWVTNVKLLSTKQCPEAYPMRVSLGCSPGIISASGFPFEHNIEIAFRVCVQSFETESVEKPNEEMISWNNDKYELYKTTPNEPNLVVSLNQLTINDDHETVTSKWCTETVDNEIALFRELLSEIECKIGKLTLARLLNARDSILSVSPCRTLHSEEVLRLYDDLVKLDSDHLCYYKDERSLVLLQQVTASLESLSRHYYRYRDSELGYFVCVRLSHLSLTRLGSTEKLLWVQMLDLSHNELRSLEGVESLQLLSCLNLSHNKLCSITSLGPIRLLKSLKVLDVSYNEIGSHSVDTTRYLCPSPLSHTEDIHCESREVVIDFADVEKYWEAFLVFRELDIYQLDISGNAIAGEHFRSLLTRFLPKLKWLDGELLH